MRSTVWGQLQAVIEADARTCGTTLDAWLAEHAAPLQERLQRELETGESMP